MPTFADAANCEISQLESPSIAEKLYCLTSFDSSYQPCVYAQNILANTENVQIMLNVIANKKVDSISRIYIIRTILTNIRISLLANSEGAIQILIDIIKDDESSQDLLDAAIDLLNSNKYYKDKQKLIEILQGFIHDIEYGNENLKVLSARTLVCLTGWRYSSHRFSFQTRSSPVYTLTSEIGAIESICSALKSAELQVLTNHLCNLVAAIIYNNNFEGFSIFIDLGIVDILLHKLDTYKDTAECRPILLALEAVSRTEIGQDEILNSSFDIEKLFKHLLSFEKTEILDCFIENGWSEKGLFTCTILRILSKLSFSTRISPLVLENILQFDSNKTIWWLGFFMRQALSGALVTRDKVYEIINLKMLKKELFTVGEMSLMQGFLVYCEKKYVDELIDLDIHNILLTILKTETGENILFWVWRCVYQLCQGSVKALKSIYSSDIVSFLPLSIEKGSCNIFRICCETVARILDVEEGALKLPTTPLVTGLAGRLNISGEFFQNSYNLEDSPFPDAVQASNTLKLLVTKQPPQTAEKVREEVFTVLFEQVWKLVVRMKSSGIIYFFDSSSFMELLKSLQKCKLFKAMQSSRLDRLLSAQSDEGDLWEETFFFFMFSESIDDPIAEEKLSNVFMDNNFGSKLTSERRAHILYTLSSRLVSSKVKVKFSKKPIFDSVLQILNSSSSRDIYEVTHGIHVIVSTISSSSNDIIDLIISKNVISYIFSFYQSTQSKILCTTTIIEFISTLVEKAYKTGEGKLAEVAQCLFENSILEVIESLVREDKEALLHSKTLTVVGYLLSVPFGISKLESTLQDLSFTQLTKVVECEAGQVAVLSSEKLLNRVVDTIKSQSDWENLADCEKESILNILAGFAFIVSPFKLSTLVAIPEVLGILKKYLSLLSSTLKDVVSKALECLVIWFYSFCDSLANSEVAKLLVQVVIRSYKVCKTSRNEHIKNIFFCCLNANTSNSELFLRELVSTLITYVSSSSGIAVLNLLEEIYPNDSSYLMLKSKSIFAELGGLEVLIDKIRVPILYRTRSCMQKSCFLVGYILQCEVGVKKFDEMDGISTVINLLKDETNVPQFYLWILLIYVTDSSWNGCTSLLDKGLLEMITPATREGSDSKGFYMVLQILQLLCYRGNDEHRQKIAKSEACQLTVECLINGSVVNSTYITRIFYLLGYSINYNLKVKEYILELLNSVDISSTKLSLSAIEKLSQICDSKCTDYYEFLQTSRVGSKLLPLYEHDDVTFQQSDRDRVSNLIFKLVKFIPQEFTNFGKALSKQFQTRLLNMETPTNEALIVSYMAKSSHNAKALIVSSSHRIFGDFDSGNEQFACIMLSVLLSFCDSHDGMGIMMDFGAVDILTQTLAISRTAEMKVGVLKVLRRLSVVESNRTKLNNIVEPVFHILTSYAHMELIESVTSVPKTSEETQKFPFDLFISHDWGVDELNRNNHDRVSKINALLQTSGCKTWFDDEQMRGSINSRMAKGISESATFAVFLTNNYIKKASGLGSKGEDDSCFFEFDLAALERGRTNMIAIVLEPSCRDTSKWAAGVVKGKLGTKLYIDLSANEDDDSFSEGITKLLREISALTGKTFGERSITENAKGAGETSKRKYKDVAHSFNDIKIATEAIQLLFWLSLSESNRTAFERMGDQLVSYIEYLCESRLLGPGQDFFSISILANVYGQYIDLPLTEDATVRNKRIRECLKNYDHFNLVYKANKYGGKSSKTDKNELFDLHACFICISYLAYIEEFRSHELISAFIEDIIRIVNEGSESLIRMESVHKITACEILTRCCKSDECRKLMISLGAEKLVRSINASVKANDENEDNARLWFSSKQTIDALSGYSDASSEASSNWFKASQLIQNGSITDSDISAIPTYQTFISYKRSSAQDFARLLHSMITSNNCTACLDVENLDRIDMLSLLVAGSDVFICVLSDDVFKSIFWKEELSYAVKAAIPIILVVKDGSRFPDTYGQMTESFPSYELIDREFSDELEHCRSVFKSKGNTYNTTINDIIYSTNNYFSYSS